MSNNIRIKYIRDPQQKGHHNERVVTVVTRKNDDGTISIGWSINAAAVKEIYTYPGGRFVSDKSIKIYKGDRFNKKMGVHVAKTRLSTDPITVSAHLIEDVEIDEFHAVLHTLLQRVSNYHVKKLVQQELDWRKKKVLPPLQKAREMKSTESTHVWNNYHYDFGDV